MRTKTATSIYGKGDKALELHSFQRPSPPPPPCHPPCGPAGEREGGGSAAAGVLIDRALIAELTRRARFLAPTRQDADDLVQDTLTAAWTYRITYRPGTNLRAWLLTILGHQHGRAGRRRSARRLLEVAAEDLQLVEIETAVPPGQMARVEVQETARRLAAVPRLYREALVLVAVYGFSVEEAADRLRVAPGTVKSRVSRARDFLRA